MNGIYTTIGLGAIALATVAILLSIVNSIQNDGVLGTKPTLTSSPLVAAPAAAPVRSAGRAAPAYASLVDPTVAMPVVQVRPGRPHTYGHRLRFTDRARHNLVALDGVVIDRLTRPRKPAAVSHARHAAVSS